ncbi:MAG: Ig-like domain-containing protein, partial [Erysipelotrichaceae bacterium]|nr:Ig-like domain-containing protein [Erysipelotrichaceae bacterium]
WTSSDPTIATVDENGVVKAVSVGTVTVTATSNQTPETTAEIIVNVVKAEPMNAFIFGMVDSGDEVDFDYIDLNNMAAYTMVECNEILNGGRSGNYFYGVNSGGVIRRFDLNDFSEDEDFSSALQSTYVMTDGATVFGWKNGQYDYPFVAAGVTEKNILTFYTETSNLWYLDATDLEQIVAMALVDIDTEDMSDPTFYYALLSDQGTVYIYYVYGIVLDDGSIDIDGRAIELGKVSGMTFGDDPTAYSMTCGFGHIYNEDNNPDYSQYGLFVADNTTKGIYYIDLNELLDGGATKARFVGVVEGAKNISGLFNDMYDALTAEDFADDQGSVIADFAADKEVVSSARGQKVELATEKAEAVETEPVVEETVETEPVVEETAEPTVEEVAEPVVETVEEPVTGEAEEPVVEAEETVTEGTEETETAGTLNRVMGYNGGTVKVRNAEEPETEEAEPTEEGETVAVEIKASDLNNNGLYEVIYDPIALKYDRTESDLEFTSDHDDE